MRIRLNLAVKNYENSRTYPEVDAFLDYSNISSWRLRENNVVGILQLEQYGLPTHQLPIIADFTMTSTSRPALTHNYPVRNCQLWIFLSWLVLLEKFLHVQPVSPKALIAIDRRSNNNFPFDIDFAFAKNGARGTSKSRCSRDIDIAPEGYVEFLDFGDSTTGPNSSYVRAVVWKQYAIKDKAMNDPHLERLQFS